MKRPIWGDLADEAFVEFKKGSHYKNLVKPFKDKIQYPDNFLRRIFDEAFMLGRVSKRNYPTTSGEAIILQTRYVDELFKKYRK